MDRNLCNQIPPEILCFKILPFVHMPLWRFIETFFKVFSDPSRITISDCSHPLLFFGVFKRAHRVVLPLCFSIDLENRPIPLSQPHTSPIYLSLKHVAYSSKSTVHEKLMVIPKQIQELYKICASKPETSILLSNKSLSIKKLEERLKRAGPHLKNLILRDVQISDDFFSFSTEVPINGEKTTKPKQHELVLISEMSDNEEEESVESIDEDVEDVQPKEPSVYADRRFGEYDGGLTYTLWFLGKYCPNIEKLYIYCSPPSVFEYDQPIFPKNTVFRNLKELYISEDRLRDEFVAAILSRMPNLQRFDIVSYKASLSEYFDNRKWPNIKAFDLEKEDLRCLDTILKYNQKLETLILHYPKPEQISKCLKKATHLTFFQFQVETFFESDLQIYGTDLKKSNLITFALDLNKIQDENGFAKLCNYFPSSLEQLQLSGLPKISATLLETLLNAAPSRLSMHGENISYSKLTNKYTQIIELEAIISADECSVLLDASSPFPNLKKLKVVVTEPKDQFIDFESLALNTTLESLHFVNSHHPTVFRHAEAIPAKFPNLHTLNFTLSSPKKSENISWKQILASRIPNITVHYPDINFRVNNLDYIPYDELRMLNLTLFEYDEDDFSDIEGFWDDGDEDYDMDEYDRIDEVDEEDEDGGEDEENEEDTDDL